MSELGKPFGKKFYPKILRHSKNQDEIDACERETTSEKAIFRSNAVFSFWFKIRVKKPYAAKPLFFALLPVLAWWPKSLLQYDSKNHENVRTDL